MSRRAACSIRRIDALGIKLTVLVGALAVAVWIGLSIFGPEFSGHGARSPLNDQLDELADRACACATAACAEQVTDELVSFLHRNASAPANRSLGWKAGARLGRCALQAGMARDRFIARLQDVE